ncbi:unnamed protein product (macronuclear) [Paramecium tetraurelia]|uniref:Uncharacterized protein n=1 Tax=Paramecium tetraurelia TaxID=5888 RepID=A0DT44_PARTE|nr:uncharacterized protein GSPATT00019904001 [Paramecium tetraurelia]CAK86211.1 unnamed protein product [Paramecium tetraurelia]|eukprot:XP_001453608.1 hypothetical protein (macronuclear) [Paramecium tetraurelia strain d4-2]
MIEFQDNPAQQYLNVKINSEILGKFFFDLSTSWCTHLDIELFHIFGFTLFFAVTKGDKIKQSQFMPLYDIQALPRSFFEDSTNLKITYQKFKKKNLIYYRAWCEWNYLRMPEIGETMFDKLISLFPDDARVEDFYDYFSNIIEIVSKEITSSLQNQNTKDKDVPNKNHENQQSQIQQENTQQQDSKDDEFQKLSLEQDEAMLWYEQQKKELPEEFKEQKSDVLGRCYLQQIQPLPPDLFVLRYNEREKCYVLERKVKIPIIGVQKPIVNTTGNDRIQLQKQYFKQDKDTSLFYTSNPVNDVTVIAQQQNQPKQQQLPKVKKQNTQLERVNKSFSQYDKINTQEKGNILLPQFAQEQLVQKQANTPGIRLFEQYSTEINVKKREVKQDLPLQLIKHPRSTVTVDLKEDSHKELGRINLTPIQSFRQASQLHNTNLTFKQIQSIQDSKHLWQSMMTQEEMEVLLQDEKKFYHMLHLLKLKFNFEHRSEYLKQFKLKLDNISKRDEMGGILTNEDRKRFHERITIILEREKKRKKRRRRNVIDPYKQRNRSWSIKTKFKNRNCREQFKQIFITPLIQ